ncbi:MAG: PTS sugar transporter subunit IIC [Clostridia bacterium]|nr:PTS sugar transporter subunit IIC [Clostridia bacterium]
MTKKKSGFKAFLERKEIVISWKRYFVDALGSMALGLFATLLMGTIFGTLGDKLGIEFFLKLKEYAQGATGCALGVSIAIALKAPALVMLSAAVVGLAGNTLGGPVGAFLATLVSVELGKMVSKETPVDIIVTPTVTIASGCAVALTVGPWVSQLMTWLGDFITTATMLQPFFMGIIVSVVVGVVLTLPISSAALCVMLGLQGLAAGAATAGCCAQMIGFAIMSFNENKWGGLLAQGVGTSMLQMGNIMKNPRIWIPPTLAAACTGPVATMVFKLESNAVSAGMGTCGFVGPIGIISTMEPTAQMWIGMILVCFVLPAILTPLFALPLRKIGWIKDGDLKLSL